jgi:valyl-tRNA synthetase
VSGSCQIFVHNIRDLIDVDGEIRRVEKQLKDMASSIQALEKKLANPSFLERAPAEVVEKDRGRLAEGRDREAKLRAHLSRLQELKG